MASSKVIQIYNVFTIFLTLNCTFAHQYATAISKLRDLNEMKKLIKTVDSDEVSYRVDVGENEIVFRVVNGKAADLGNVPYQVALMALVIIGPQKGNYSAKCGGTIISPKKIITAAHCVEKPRLFDIGKGHLRKKDFRDVYVVAGQLKTTAKYGLEGQWRKIKCGKYPAKYNFPADDIALLFLKNELNFNDYVQPVAYASTDIDYDLECLVSGYGMISDKEQSDILLLASIRLLPKKRCKKILEGIKTDNLICTSDKTADINSGDSGGPLVCKGTGDPAEEGSARGILTGIVSGRSVTGPGSFFTRVSSFHKFINCAHRSDDTTWILLCFISYILTS